MKLTDRIWRLTVSLTPFVVFAFTLVASRRWL